MRKVAEEGLLSPDDYELYIKLNQSLLLFAAQRTGTKPGLKSREEFLKLKLEEKLKIRDVLMKDIALLDEFVGSNPFNFSETELEIVRGWKDFVLGTFYLVKVTSEGGIFLDWNEKGPKVYVVLALSTAFEYVLRMPPPARVEAVLLPFKGRIVYDGMMRSDNILIGGGIARSLRAEVDRAIARNGLITSLPFLQPKSYTEEEKLAFYLRTKESREEHWDEIDRMIAKNKALLPGLSSRDRAGKFQAHCLTAKRSWHQGRVVCGRRRNCGGKRWDKREAATGNRRDSARKSKKFGLRHPIEVDTRSNRNPGS
jgi:hypothetical protein